MPTLIAPHAKSRRIVFAASHDWWTWDHPRIRDALLASRLAHMSEIVEVCLESNRNSARSPKSWFDLVAEGRIRRDGHHLQKIKRGQHGCNDLILLGFATALNLDIAQLLPTTLNWIASATIHVCRDRIEQEDAIIYSSRRLQHRSSPTSGNGTISPQSDAAFERVVQLLDPILIAFDREMEERRASK